MAMPGCFASMFANEKPKFNEQMNLSDNFIAMCSLSWPKSDSIETIELKTIIKDCHFTEDDNSRPYDRYEARLEKRMQQLAKLETVKLAVQMWRDKRDKPNRSTRVPSVKKFERESKHYQDRISDEDRQDFIGSFNQHKNRSWNNPIPYSSDSSYDWATLNC